MYTTAKRFPPSCRFYIQGNCRAGRDCHFAHVLPLSHTPNNPNIVEKAPSTPIPSSNSLQKVIRDIELAQLEKKYSTYIQKATNKDSTNTLIELLLPIENKEDLNVLLIIPNDYPDTPCILRIQNIDISTEATSEVQAAFEDHKWPQKRHPTLVQQLAWLTTHFTCI